MNTDRPESYELTRSEAPEHETVQQNISIKNNTSVKIKHHSAGFMSVVAAVDQNVSELGLTA